MNTGKETVQHLSHVSTGERQLRTKTMNQAQNSRQLYGKLKRTADNRTPRRHRGERCEIDAVVEIDQRGNDRRVPRHGSGVGNEETMMTVQNSQAPR